MQFSVTFRHMESTDALKQYAEERMQKIKKYFPDPIACHVVLSTERHNHRVDVNLQLHNGLQVAGHEATDNMYSSIDLVVAKIERQVRRYKDKLRDHKVRADMTPLPVSHSVLQDDWIEPASEHEPSPPEEREAAAAEGDGVPRVVTREKFHAQPMEVGEAIMQLNLLHEQFLVFRNAETAQVNVVYRRDDGSYGLIETGSE